MTETPTRQPSYSFEELMACARGEMFGPGNAQLPAPPMLLFDRITTITDTGGEFDKGYIEAEFDINPQLWFFNCQSASRPRLPGMTGSLMKWQSKNQSCGLMSNSASI